MTRYGIAICVGVFDYMCEVLFTPGLMSPVLSLLVSLQMSFLAALLGSRSCGLGTYGRVEPTSFQHTPQLLTHMYPAVNSVPTDPALANRSLATRSEIPHVVFFGAV